MKKIILGLSLFFVCAVTMATESVSNLKQDETVFTDKNDSQLAATEDAVLDEKSKAAQELSNKKESEIPLNLDSPKKANADDHPIAKTLMTLAVLGILMTGSFYYIRKKGATSQSKAATQIKVLTQHYLGPKKSLAIVRVAGESILIGITDQNISMLKSLSLLDEEVPEVAPASFESTIKNLDFVSDQAEIERKNKIRYSGNRSSDVALQLAEQINEDEFSIRKIKDVVSKKLKNMRTLE